MKETYTKREVQFMLEPIEPIARGEREGQHNLELHIREVFNRLNTVNALPRETPMGIEEMPFIENERGRVTTLIPALLIILVLLFYVFSLAFDFNRKTYEKGYTDGYQARISQEIKAHRLGKERDEWVRLQTETIKKNVKEGKR